MFAKPALQAYIKSLGLKHKSTVNSYIFNCPSPDCQKSDKFYIRKSDGAFVCWVCGYKGKRVEEALSLLTGDSISNIRFAIYGDGEFRGNNLNLELEDEVYDSSSYSLIDLNPISTYFDAISIDHPQAEKGLKYLESRNIPLNVVKKYDILYSPSMNRVLFQAKYDGKLYGWQGRTIIDAIPKTLNSTTQNGSGWRSKILMFLDNLAGSEHCVLCEGPVDAIKADLCGGNVASLGKIVTDTQLSLIRRLGIQKLYLGLDPDAANESAKIVREMTKDTDCYLIEVPSKFKDIGEMDYGEVFEAFKHAKKLTNNYLFIHINGK